jgi:hypothetical protein
LITYSALATSVILAPLAKQRVAKNSIIPLIPLSALAFCALNIVNAPLADILVSEDGIIEWMSAILLFIASVVMAGLTVRLIRHKQHPLSIAAAITCSVIFFVIGMEEISWMQRIFDVKTPLYLLEKTLSKK